MVELIYRDYLIRDWRQEDREIVSHIISNVLQEYNLTWQPEEADKDVVEIEHFYLKTGGEFWVVEKEQKLIGTAAYYPISRGENAVEIRKMYLLSIARRKGLGKYLLQELENAIFKRGFREIWLETASVLKEAVCLYENNGYQPTTEVETKRCDRAYYKKLSNPDSSR
jgi:putative acetyltransferase